MKTAHLQRSLGGGLGGPLRSLPQRLRRQSRRSNEAPAQPPRLWTVLIAGNARGTCMSYALDDSFAEQALWAEQQERQRQHVGEPVFDRAADQRAPVDFGDLFADADDEAAGDGAGDRREAAEDEDGQRLEGDEREAELHAALGAPHD